mgnify:CR=1 FL=1
MKKGYYITDKGEKVIIDSQESIDLSYKNIVELILPSGIKYVYCHNNQLKELILPSGVKYVYCYNNQLKELILPSGIEFVSCENNNITGLILPSGIKNVYCDDGAIENPMFYKNWDINLVIYFYK